MGQLEGDYGGHGMAPFEKHPASPEAVEQHAKQLESQANVTLSEKAATDAAFTPALENWEGMAADELRNAPEPVRQTAYNMSTNLAWSALPLRYWADRVRDFNAKVDQIVAGLNGQPANFGAKGKGKEAPTEEAIADARAEVYAAARDEWHKAHSAHILDGSTTAAAMFKDGPTIEHLAEAAAVGAIPMTPWNRALIYNAIPNTEEEGRRLGQELRERIESGERPSQDPTAYNVADLLTLINAEAQAHAGDPNYRIPPDQMAFLQGLYAGLGPALTKLPQYLREVPRLERTIATREGSDTRDDRAALDRLIRQDAEDARVAFGDGLLILSNEDLGGGYAKVPPAVWDAIHDLPRQTTETDQTGFAIVSLEGGDGFMGLASLLRGTHAEGGDVLSREITVSTADLAHTMDELDHAIASASPGTSADYSGYGEHRGRFNDAAEIMLDASTRNHQANYEVLTGRDYETGKVITDRDGNPLIDSKQTVLDLYRYNWNDHGKSAAGLTDGIAEDARAAHDGEPPKEDRHASEAAAALINLVTESPDDEGHGLNTYDDMEHELRDNPELARSMARVAGNYLHAFGEPLTGVTHAERDGTLVIGDQDAKRFVTLIGTDKDASNALSAASGIFQRDMLDRAIHGEKDPLLHRVLDLGGVAQRAGQLDGLIAGGRVNAMTMHGEDLASAKLQAWREHTAIVGAVKSIPQTLLGQIPGVGSYLSVTAGQAVDLYMVHGNPPPGMDDFKPPSISALGGDDMAAAHDYLSGMVAADKIKIDEIDKDLVNVDPETGEKTLKTPSEITSDTGALVDEARRLGDEDRKEIGDDDYSFETYNNAYNAKEAYNDVRTGTGN
jgi:uncharacterized protein YukE